MFKKFIAAVDGSEHGWKALDVACDLAKQGGGEIVVLSVYRHQSALESTHSLVRREAPEHPDATLSRFAREIVDEGMARAQRNGVTAVEGMVRRGPPARTIVQVAAEHGADVIVMGSRGLGDVEGFLLGSVSHKVCSISQCTCITVK